MHQYTCITIRYILGDIKSENEPEQGCIFQMFANMEGIWGKSAPCEGNIGCMHTTSAYIPGLMEHILFLELVSEVLCGA